MNVIDMTRELGTVIQLDERYTRFTKARAANDANEELQASIGEFNIIRMQLDNCLAEENRDEDKISELNEKLRTVYGSVMASPAMAEYNASKAELDHMLNDINSIIMKSVEGEDPKTCDVLSENCSGSCSSCGGCG